MNTRRILYTTNFINRRCCCFVQLTPRVRPPRSWHSAFGPPQAPPLTALFFRVILQQWNLQLLMVSSSRARRADSKTHLDLLFWSSSSCVTDLSNSNGVRPLRSWYSAFEPPQAPPLTALFVFSGIFQISLHYSNSLYQRQIDYNPRDQRPLEVKGQRVRVESTSHATLVTITTPGKCCFWSVIRQHPSSKEPSH